MVADWIEHPGSYIREELEERGWNQRDLAFVLEVPEQAVNMIISGKRGISPEMAKALGAAFDVPGELFANLQQAYEMSRARTPDTSVAVRGQMQSVYPVREMIKRQWIEMTDAAMLESQLMRFFGVSTPSEIPYMPHAAKKSSYEEREVPPAQLAWLFRVRQIAKSISVPKYSEKKLQDALRELQLLMLAPEDARNVPRILADAGVRFIIVEKLPGANIDGVCFWLDGSPVIAMTMRFDRIDNFWFVLRHEIDHVLRGDGKTIEVFDELEGERASTNESLPSEERAANATAADFCAPVDKLDSFMKRKHPFYYEKDAIAFARVVQRHPGIVIGQMRFRMKRMDYLTRHLVKIRQFVLPGAIVDGWGQFVPVSL
jgi:HTH-type transcriptional regulator / antitoxin HigA